MKKKPDPNAWIHKLVAAAQREVKSWPAWKRAAYERILHKD